MRLAAISLLLALLAACGGGSVGGHDAHEADTAPPHDTGPEPDVDAVEPAEPQVEPVPEPVPEPEPDIVEAEAEAEAEVGPEPDVAEPVPDVVEEVGEVEACGCANDADCPVLALPCRESRCLDCACVEVERDDGALCNDLDPCTEADACLAGACLGQPVDCSDATPCTADSCGADGACVHAPVDGGCDDGNACTTDDACADGLCVGTTLSCADDDECTDDRCLPATGCVHAPVGGPCSDDDACTADDACDGGACKGTPVSCDDGNPCTVDGCDPVGGCTHAPLDKGDCDDQSVCTTGDHCEHGQCVGTPLPCDDLNACTSDGCDPVLGCLNPARPGLCDDGSACTRDDQCVGTACVGSPLPCDDGDPCTDDACEEALGCVYADNEAPCDDLSPCTTGDHCAAGVCAGSPVTCSEPPAATCVDGGAAVKVGVSPGVCVDGSCAYATETRACASGCVDGACVGDPCAGATCDTPPGACLASPGTCVAGACTYAYLVGDACDDANACTDDDACEAGVCRGRPRWCDAPPAPVCLGLTERLVWQTGGTCAPADGTCTYAHVDESCAGGCVGGSCLAAAALVSVDLTAFGGAGLESALHALRGVSTPWIDGATMTSATWNLTMGFEP